MEKTFKFVLFVALISFLSCNNENEFVKPDIQQIKDFELVNLKDFTGTKSTLKTAVQQEQFVLRFKDEAAYEKVIGELQKMSKKERLIWGTNLEEFNSLQKIYEQAMKDIENVDETEVSYMTFKEKYDRYLYFPMYKEDMGFYIPMIEQEKAIIANADGLIIIGDEVKNLKNITSYSDLQITGQAYYTPGKMISTRATAYGSINSDFIGEEIDSGWFKDKDGDRKLRFKIGRKSNKGNINPIPPDFSNPYGTPGFNFKMNLKLEISFRKKTWLGWVNYSSETKTNMQFIIEGKTYVYIHNEEGASSHDWMDANSLPWGFSGQYATDGHRLFYTNAIDASFSTFYRAFDTPDGSSIIRWSCTLPFTYFVE
ncbi:DUF4848 domain-containing protein [Parabacteroides sp. Marseille-P3160]|uniref:DUF4848 domain-containing protein n=1 Tax=Parabacteroides sp. Marseille-P3160 TaxID=1917887 RepID=UPI0009B97DD0|nr:DUF4848 domain-containing protein [Parabacteroides sp. Marseille-P3160]